MKEDDIKAALAAAGLTDETLAEKWFDAIRETRSNADDSWSSFKEELSSNAREFDFAFDDNFVAEFHRKVEDSLTDPLAAVEAMAETENQELLTTFKGLRAAEERSRSGVQGLTWVTGTQQDRLRGTLGEGWKDVVRGRLDKEWSGWKAATEDQLVTFLDQWMPTILGQATPAPADDVTALLWTTGTQRERLHSALGDAWGTVVRGTLDKEWSGWKAATKDQLVTFLDQWMPTILAQAAPAVDVTALHWTTGSQRQQLLAGLGDAWPDGVRATLDKEWSGWKSATDGQLVTFLDQWMHVVLAPARTPAAPIGEVLSHDAAVVAQNPEFEKIAPRRRQELINEVLAEQVAV